MQLMELITGEDSINPIDEMFFVGQTFHRLNEIRLKFFLQNPSKAEFVLIHQNEQNTDFHPSDHLMLIGLRLVPATKITMMKFILTESFHFHSTAKTSFN